MQQGAGENIGWDYPFVWGWKQQFRGVLNHKNDDGTPRQETALTNVIFEIYNNKSCKQTLRRFELTANEGITVDGNKENVTINVDYNDPVVLPIGQYYYIIWYERTGLGLEQVKVGDYHVTVDGKSDCVNMNYISSNIEIVQVNGLRAELDNLAAQATRLSSNLWQIDGSNSAQYLINVPDADFTAEPPIYASVWKDGSLIPFVFSGGGVGIDIYNATNLYLKNYSFGLLNLANAKVQILYNKV